MGGPRRADQPTCRTDPDEIAQEWAQVHHDSSAPVFVPYVDPDSGGIHARVLFLLESPAGPVRWAPACSRRITTT